ncbi:MAG: polymorphic toxin type 28 domain-containing protein [Acidobacteriota bacterium]
MTFTYDNLGRVDFVNMPPGFDDIDAAWSKNSVTIDRGSSKRIVKSWDGLGRGLGHTETDYTVTLNYLKLLDDEGRVKKESKGSTDAGNQWEYGYNAAGDIRSTKDPEQKEVTVDFPGAQKTVTDAKGYVWKYEYAHLPGRITTVHEPQPDGHSATNQYDGLGRLTNAKLAGSREHWWTYNGMDQVAYEHHPETDTIQLDYNAEGNLSRKTWGGTIIDYTYRFDNQLQTVTSADETITYSYNTNGLLTGISSTKGPKRINISYNSLGSVKGETLVIPGISNKKLVYDYDGGNSLKMVKYPDTKVATILNNGLDAPNKVSFNSGSGDTTLIESVVYGSYRQPRKIDLAGSTSAFGSDYDEAGHLLDAALAYGAAARAVAVPAGNGSICDALAAAGSLRYRNKYRYDNNYNITHLDNADPGPSADFTYDSLNRLKTADYGAGGRVTNFSYDPDAWGNMLTVKEDNTTVFNKTYDGSNRIAGFQYDLRGNLTADGMNTYVWDAFNRLTQVSRLLSGQTVPTVLTENLYDDRAMRMRTVRPISQSADTPTITIDYPNGGEQIEAGKKCRIRWHVSGTWNELSYVTIGLTTNGDAERPIYRTVPLPGEVIRHDTGYYDWLVPEELRSTKCLIAISDKAGQASDKSDEFFSIVEPASTETLQVLYPKNGTKLTAGSICKINWQLNPPITGGRGLKIEYTTDASVANPIWTKIADKVAYQPPYKWEVPPTLSTQCKVRASDMDGREWGKSTGLFTIKDVTHSIRILYPNGGQTLKVGSRYTLKWDTTGAIQNVKIEYTWDDGGHWPNVAETCPNTGEYLWDVPGDHPSELCRIKVTEIGGQHASGTSAELFTIADFPAKIYVTDPDGPNDACVIGTFKQILWKSTHTEQVPLVNIQLSIDSGGEYPKTIKNGADNKQGWFNWKVWGYPQSGDAQPHCRIRIQDADGIPSDTSHADFPIIESIKVERPAKEEEVPIGKDYVIQWIPKGNPSKVRVELSRTGREGPYVPIDPDNEVIKNEGHCHWIVSGPESNNCFIRVKHASVAYPGSEDTNDTAFSIVPSITVTNPKVNQKVVAGSNLMIKWTTAGSVPKVKILASTDGGKTFPTVIAASVTNNTSPKAYPWSVPNWNSSKCVIKVSDLDGDPFDLSPLFRICTQCSTGGEGEDPELDYGTGEAEAPPQGTEEDYGLAPDGSRLMLEDTLGDASKVWEGDPDMIYAPADEALGLPDFMWEKSPDDGCYEWPEEPLPEGGWNQWNEDALPPEGDPGQQAPTPFTPPPGSEVVYYVYGHDGKLLAEYDTNGFCDRDYIYAGNRLIAEYRPKESKFYFYAQDQINSTRVVTDQSGTRTYAATYDPFGGLQFETGDTTAPTLKFSGKERDTSTGFDYFGARWYAHGQYRWISVDPVMNHDDALSNPQLWNLYAYCENNPLTKLDPDGRDILDWVVAQFREIMSTVGFDYTPPVAYMDGQFSATTPAVDKTIQGAAVATVIIGAAAKAGATKTDNVKEHLTQADLDAARRESQGQVVARKPDGTPYDHVTEVQEAQRALVKRIEQINKLRADPNLTDEQRAALEKELSEASKLLDHSEGYLPR